MVSIFAASYLLPINGSPVEGGAVVVENGLIRAVGRLKDLRGIYSATPVEFPGCVIMPGLVNTHTHLELTNYPQWLCERSIDSSALSYVDWIKQVITVKREINFKELSLSLTEGMRISLQSGSTMVGDILSDRRLLPLYGGSPLSGRIYLEFLGQRAERFGPLLDSLDSDLEGIPGNFLPGISPHAPFTVSDALLSSLLHKGRTASLPLSMHLAESIEESLFFLESGGRIADELYPFVGWDSLVPEPMGISSTRWLQSAGALSPDFLAVHGVHLANADIGMIKESGASIVLVPRSNERLGVGRAPLKELLEAGIPLSLGTDSMASSASLSLWDEIRFLLDSFPGIVSPEDAIRIGTIGGAHALKRGHEAGSMEVGKRADFLVMQSGSALKGNKIYEQLADGSTVTGVWTGGNNVWKGN